MSDTHMGSYYPNSSSQTNGLSSAPYPQDQKFAAFSESSLLNGNMMMYLNQGSSTGSLDISPVNPQNGVQINPMTGRNEMMFIPPLNTEEELQLTSRGNIGISDGEQNLQGLSLSLSTQMSTVVSSPSFQYQYSNPGLSSSVLSPHLPLSVENSVRPLACKVDETSPSKDMRNSDYFSYGMNGGDGHNTVRFGSANSHSQYGMNLKGMNCSQYQYDQVGVAGLILKSRYIKIAQELLDEVVNVRDALKRPESEKDKSSNKGDGGSKECKDGSQPSVTNESGAGSGSSHELSPAEQQDLQSKLDKLHSMLDEVDRRYKQYCHQMQMLVSSFDMVAGGGAAKPYTALALKTISRHFRCLRDVIIAQIQATRKNLGELDNGLGVIPRLRYVDQQLRQQRALQQFGMMRHAWRPQRGLPENAVTILRAWLFEHFLHPYPKDSEKLLLARQTGLTRGQVANWFINARVRLWKPMVEEMYKEEFGDGDINSRCSPDNTPKLRTEKSWGSEDRRDEMHDSSTSMPNDRHDSNMDPILNPGSETKEPTSLTPGFHIGAFGSTDHQGFFTNTIPHDPNTGAHAHLMVSSSGYQIPELGNFNVDNNNQVSLALGLQHHEGTTEATVGGEASDYSFLDQVNQQHQHRFGNPHILNHFVA